MEECWSMCLRRHNLFFSHLSHFSHWTLRTFGWCVVKWYDRLLRHVNCFAHMWHMKSWACSMWATFTWVVKRPADANLKYKSTSILNLLLFLFGSYLGTLHFSTFVADVGGPFFFRLMCDTVRYQCTAVAETSGTVWTGQRSLSFGQMILYVILKDFRARQHLITLRAFECVWLQMTCHMQGHRTWLNQFWATTYHITLHRMLHHIMMIQIAEFSELRTLSVNRENSFRGTNAYAAWKTFDLLAIFAQITFKSIEFWHEFNQLSATNH